jgi:hypothetical protein
MEFSLYCNNLLPTPSHANFSNINNNKTGNIERAFTTLLQFSLSSVHKIRGEESFMIQIHNAIPQISIPEMTACIWRAPYIYEYPSKKEEGSYAYS